MLEGYRGTAVLERLVMTIPLYSLLSAKTGNPERRESPREEKNEEREIIRKCCC